MPDGTLLRLLRGGPRLTVGMTTADLLHLGDELDLLERGSAELVHIDVMDGVFCPMLTIGPPVIRAMRTTLIKDVHLLVTDPLAKIDSVVAAGADMVTFQVEGAPQPDLVLRALATAVNANDPARGIIRGVAVKPSTPIEVLEPLLGHLEYLLVLAVNPGLGGQRFDPATARRLEQIRRMVEANGDPILVGVDGAVTRDNIAQVTTLGADLIVSGSAIFDGKAAAANLRFMLQAVSPTAASPGSGGELRPT